MTSPAGRGQLGVARRAVQLAGRRTGRPDRAAAGRGGQPVWVDDDPPTEPLPAVPAGATSMMTWSPPRLPDAATRAAAVFRTATAALWLVAATGAGVGIWYMFQPSAGDHFDPRRRGD